MSSSTLVQTRTGRGALTAGLLLFIVVLAVILSGGLVTRAAMPGASGHGRALVVLVVLSALTVAARPCFGSWRDLGVNGPRAWARPTLLVLPLLLAVSPLGLGIRHVGASTWGVLVVGYLLTGFTEELLWRGIAQRLLDPLGPARGVLVASALFGCAHLGNVLFRDNVALVAAQAWGAFCFGVGYAALRRRLQTLVPLMVLHMLTDLCAAIAARPAILVLVAQDTVLLTVGVVMLSRDARANKPDELAGSRVTRSPRRPASLG
ncbi:MAG: CPBP family intramembrane glutamic endopeptidase [Nakamurella sp.]